MHRLDLPIEVREDGVQSASDSSFLSCLDRACRKLRSLWPAVHAFLAAKKEKKTCHARIKAHLARTSRVCLSDCPASLLWPI